MAPKKKVHASAVSIEGNIELGPQLVVKGPLQSLPIVFDPAPRSLYGETWVQLSTCCHWLSLLATGFAANRNPRPLANSKIGEVAKQGIEVAQTVVPEEALEDDVVAGLVEERQRKKSKRKTEKLSSEERPILAVSVLRRAECAETLTMNFLNDKNVIWMEALMENIVWAASFCHAEIVAGKPQKEDESVKVVNSTKGCFFSVAKSGWICRGPWGDRILKVSRFD
jgi:hypothetical protein